MSGVSISLLGCRNKVPPAVCLRQQKFIVSQSGGWKSKTKVLAGLAPPEAGGSVGPRPLPLLVEAVSLWCSWACPGAAPSLSSKSSVCGQMSLIVRTPVTLG